MSVNPKDVRQGYPVDGWEPTLELRNKFYTPTGKPELQQRWRRPARGGFEYVWRKVPDFLDFGE